MIIINIIPLLYSNSIIVIIIIIYIITHLVIYCQFINIIIIAVTLQANFVSFKGKHGKKVVGIIIITYYKY